MKWQTLKVYAEGFRTKYPSTPGELSRTLLSMTAVFCLVCQILLVLNRNHTSDDVLVQLRQATSRLDRVENDLGKVRETVVKLRLEKQRTELIVQHGRARRQAVRSLHNDIRYLRRKVKYLEARVRCADGDVSGACASKTRRKDNQGDKRRRPTTGTPTKNPNSPPKRRKSSRRKTVFVRWGKPHCNVYNRAQTTIIYTGRVASPHHTESGGGANYMCLPDKAFYTNPANISRVDRAFLYPVKYGPVQKAYQKYPDHILAIMSPEERKKHSEPLDNKDVPCAMCQIDGATSSIMIPAHNICPPMWKKQYHGYLLSQKHNAEKTEYICVDIEAEGVASSQDHPGASYLHLSEFKCTSGSCFGSYRTNEALTCVVCAT
ncbi:uncharacterized protein LOC116619038 isoform X1 [Nematostella vectensis]|uniref:uncharacterized protein LOC116619038 isoform X1 n=1 Tax=Nematostella vectensis TaxID=45351 RepID=UPI002076F5EE|nr:uncharacterized protein LOC116619038 isoform X1 [Nematostella vectensis]